MLSISYRSLVLAGLLGLAIPRWGGAQHLLNGTVRDSGGATIAVPTLGMGTATDASGRYQLELPAGPQQITVSFVGYLPQTFRVNLSRRQQRDLTLTPNTNELGEVVVQGQQTLQEKLATTQMGVEHLSIREASVIIWGANIQLNYLVIRSVMVRQPEVNSCVIMAVTLRIPSGTAQGDFISLYTLRFN